MSELIDFRLRLIDNFSREMKKTSRLTKSSLRSMSREERKLHNQIEKRERTIINLRKQERLASKEKKRSIKEQIKLERKLLKEQKKQATNLQSTQSSKFNKSGSSRLGRGIGATAGIGSLVASGTALYRATEETQRLSRDARGLFGEDADSELVGQASALSKVFQEDYNQVLMGANALTKQFGIESETAMDLVQKGFEGGANATNEYLDILKEYPVQLQEAGLTAEESIAFITKSVSSGVFSDKGVDAIKEGKIRLNQFNKETEKQITLLPKEVRERVKLNITQGNSYKAMQLISKQLTEMSDPTKKAALVTAVFGTQGEDAGMKFLESIQNINLSLEDTTSKLSDLQQAQLDLTTEWESFKTSILEDSGPISKFFTGLVNTASDFVKSLRNLNKYGESLADVSVTKAEKRFEEIKNSTSGRGVSIASRIKSQRRKLSELEKEENPNPSHIFKMGSYIEWETEQIKKIDETKALIKLLEDYEKDRDIKFRDRKEERDKESNNLNEVEPRVIRSTPTSNSKEDSKIQSDLKRFDVNRNMKSLTINIENLVDDGINITTNNITESTAQIEQVMLEALNNVVNQSANNALK